MPKFDGVDAILGDLVNGPWAFNRVPGSPRKPGIEGFGLWAGATSPPAAASTPVVRKLERAVFDADRGARLPRRRRYVSESPERVNGGEAVEALEGLAAFDRLDDNLDYADRWKSEPHGELVPLADDPALLESLAILDWGVFGDGNPHDRRIERDEPTAPETLEELAELDRLDDNLACADRVKSEPDGELVHLADDPVLLESLASLDQGVFGDVSAHDRRIQHCELKARLIAPEPPQARPSRRSTEPPGLVMSGQPVEALEGLAELDRLDDNLACGESVTPEPHGELVPLADDPVLLEGLAGLDRGVFGDGSAHDRRIQRYELKARLIAPAPTQARPSRRSTDLPGVVANGEPVRVHRWVATATLVLATCLGAAAAAFVFQQRLSLIAVRWSAPAQTVSVTDSCAVTDCLPERNR